MDTIPGSVAGLLGGRAADHPRRPYLEYARDDRVITYAEMASLVARGIAELDASAARTVFVDQADPLAFAVAHLSVIAAGRRSVPVDPAATAAEIRRLAALVGGPSALLCDDAAKARAAGIPRLAPFYARSPRQGMAAAAVDAGPVRLPERAGGSAMLFTSGSTGTPKGVELSQDRLVFVGAAVAGQLRLGPADRGYCPLPLFHINAEVVGLLGTLNSGSTLVLDSGFHRTGFWPLMTARDISWINAVPAILAVLATEAITPPPRLRCIRTASAPLPGPVAAAYAGVPLVISYGMTEAASQITATPLGDGVAGHPGSVGVPVGTEVQVRTPDGGPAPGGTVGEIWIRGRGVIAGYWDAAAADRFDGDGWLRTGDLGRVDAEGWVTLVGRSDDVINRGGEKVYPLEIEEVLLADRAVREAVVVGAPDAVLGAVPVAFVIPVGTRRGAADEDALVSRLTSLCTRTLPRFKRPVTITVVDDVPRAATGKVQRVRLRAGLGAR